MNCFVYRSKRREGAYLYLKNENDFSALPDEFQSLFGKGEFVMTLSLEKPRKLVAMDSEKLKHRLNETGYYLHLTNENVRLNQK